MMAQTAIIPCVLSVDSSVDGRREIRGVLDDDSTPYMQVLRG